jgi:putrescine transport system substrate-binding protein
LYASANASATQMVDEEITGDPAIYPPPEVKENLFPNKLSPPDYERLRTRAWTKLKTGQ